MTNITKMITIKGNFYRQLMRWIHLFMKELSKKVDAVFDSDIVKQLRGKYTGIIVKKNWKEAKKIEDIVMTVVRRANTRHDTYFASH